MNSRIPEAHGGGGGAYPVGRLSFTLYAAIALGFSLALLQMARWRGTEAAVFWLAAYAAVALCALCKPGAGPLLAGLAAFLLGFVRTWRHGVNLDLGLGLILLSLAVYFATGARDGRRRTDLGGLLLLAVAQGSVVSLAFVVARIRSFAPAPGFAYHVYRFNPGALSSDEATVRAVIGAASVFAWFGLYEYARRLRPRPELLAVGVFAALVLNGAVLFVQGHVDERFLHPPGFPLIGRLNGATSFCYALGDTVLALFLLLPVWGVLRGRWRVLTAASVALMLHAAITSGSRAALLSMVAAAVLWLALWGIRRARTGGFRGAAAPAALLTLLVAGSVVAYRTTPAGRSSALGRLRAAVEHQGVVGHLMATRFSSYPLLARVMTDYPLTGIGVGMYPAEMEKQQALLTPQLRPDPYLLATYAPNQFLNTGAELGLPALIFLVLVFGLAARSAFSGAGTGTGAGLGVSVLVLAAALQFGPGFYNSEALVFSWLVIGLAAGHARGASAAVSDAPAGSSGARVSAAVLAGTLLVSLAGQWLARSSLAIDSQWQRLRWRMTIGMQAPENTGQWTGPEATFSIDTPARAVRLRWHAGDAAAPGYHAAVTFYVDGTLVETSPARAGIVRESVLPLPAAKGFRRISVRVAPPFVPAESMASGDKRQLGIFLHSVTPVDERPAGRQ